MGQEGILKIAFRTHEEHCDYLVRPFGLINAPLTFKIVMNSSLEPFLEKFVSVIFYGMLIYNKSWEENIEHVDGVLTLLEEQ